MNELFTTTPVILLRPCHSHTTLAREGGRSLLLGEGRSLDTVGEAKTLVVTTGETILLFPSLVSMVGRRSVGQTVQVCAGSSLPHYCQSRGNQNSFLKMLKFPYLSMTFNSFTNGAKYKLNTTEYHTWHRYILLLNYNLNRWRNISINIGSGTTVSSWADDAWGILVLLAPQKTLIHEDSGAPRRQYTRLIF